jgi:hypothetical protein
LIFRCLLILEVKKDAHCVIHALHFELIKLFGFFGDIQLRTVNLAPILGFFMLLFWAHAVALQFKLIQHWKITIQLPRLVFLSQFWRIIMARRWLLVHRFIGVDWGAFD